MRYQNVATTLSLLFGLALIANIQTMGDGQWFWYAAALRAGARLYADLHLVLPPLFVLQTEWADIVVGKSWLAYKLPAVLEMAAYAIAVRLLAARLPFPDWQKGLFSLSAFFLTALFVGYRYDDYHVPSHCLVAFSALLLLKLGPGIHLPRRVAHYSILLGLLSGLAMTTRLNDGAVLVCTVLASLFVMLSTRRVLALSLCAGVALITVFFVVFLTGDTLRDYVSVSILHAAESKGGANAVAIAPILLVMITVQYLGTLFGYPAILAIVTALFVLDSYLVLRTPPSQRLSPGILTVIVLPLVVLGCLGGGTVFAGLPGEAIAGVWLLFLFLVGLMVSGRALIRLCGVRSSRPSNPIEILLLIPFGQLISGSMSSAGLFLGLYFPVALFLLLCPGVWLFPRRSWQMTVISLSALLMLISAAVHKVRVPFAWHTYISAPMFLDREWYNHPLYGPMLIEKRQLSYITGVCSQISRSWPGTELLSIPFPYANYFCGIPPWRGYVQTFFDITSAETIHRLIRDLESSPPGWILYQRQLPNLAYHELAYNGGKPLPQRRLDEMISAKLASGAWHLGNTWESAVPTPEQPVPVSATWMLIGTR